MEPPSLLDAWLGDRLVSFETPLPVDECVAKLHAQADSIIEAADPEALHVAAGVRSVRLQRGYQSLVPTRSWNRRREVEVDLSLIEKGAATSVSGAAYVGDGTKFDLVVGAGVSVVMIPLLVSIAWQAREFWEVSVVAVALAAALVACLVIIRREAISEGERTVALARQMLA
jgi:hypothetical protein